MLKKPQCQTKAGNIAKIKYFLPSNNQNQNHRPQYEYNRLNQLKRSITNKYKASHSNSKLSSKRPSVHKIENHGISLNSEINFNEDVSFQIVGIRDVQEPVNEITKQNSHKNYRYPMSEANTHSIKTNPNNPKQTGLSMTFRNQKEQTKDFTQSAFERISKLNDFEKLTKNFPKPQEKKQFQKFLQNLKNDQNYQSTITMFTIMYFYEQKAKRK